MSELDDDLVTTALLGTDRRRLPAAGPDPAGWVLAGAARRRAGRLVAGGTTVVRPSRPAPAQDLRLPDAAARAVLDDLLRHGSDGLVDLWLHEALDAGVGVAPEHWTPLLDRARRSRGLDRRRLAAALGTRGLWFARQNPAWVTVVRAAEGSPPRAPTLADVVALPTATSAGAARALGVDLGRSAPLDAYGSVAAAARPGVASVVLVALAAAEEVLWARWALAPAFDPARVPPDRSPISVPISVPTNQERP